METVHMISSLKTKALAALCGIALAAGVTPASALTIEFTITNPAPTGGVTLTPLYLGLHNGAFDAFNAGEAASPGVELLAEEGDFSMVAGERLAVAPDSMGAALTAPGGFEGAPVIEPGESASVTLRLDPTDNQYLNYLSMIIPSNDQFIGNDDPLQLFDDDGNFNGDQVINIFGDDVWDAGTEVNDTLGAAFSLIGGEATDEGGVITQGPGIDNFVGTPIPTGVLGDAALGFGGNPDFAIATIEITAVPIPATLPLIVGAFGLMGFAAHRRKAAA